MMYNGIVEFFLRRLAYNRRTNYCNAASATTVAAAAAAAVAVAALSSARWVALKKFFFSSFRKLGKQKNCETIQKIDTVKIHENLDFEGARQKGMAPSNSTRKLPYVDLFSPLYDRK